VIELLEDEEVETTEEEVASGLVEGGETSPAPRKVHHTRRKLVAKLPKSLDDFQVSGTEVFSSWKERNRLTHTHNTHAQYIRLTACLFVG